MTPNALHRLLSDAADTDADRLAVVDGDRRITHGTLVEQVATLADALRDAGVMAGRIVSFHLPNGTAPVELFRACWSLGAVAAPLHPAASPVDVESLLARIRPRVHVRDQADLDALLAGRAAHQSLGTPRLVDPTLGVLLATSGSTGPPKLVAHRFEALAFKTRQMVAVHGLDHRDVVLMPAPMAHMSGLLNGVLVPGAAGMACVTMRRWRTADALDLIERERVSFMVGPPTFFVGLLDDPGWTPDRVASLRLISCGGAGVTPAFVQRAAAGLGAVVKRTYGSTEAPTVATATAADPADRLADADGHALDDGATFRLVDPADPTSATVTEVGRGPGELCVRGPELMAGYLRDDGTLDPGVDDDGWYHTGDLATLSADGWLTITGRLKDLIIRGGENIAAAEVEQALEAHPAVHAAAVVGLPDDRLGEIVAAYVVADADAGFDLEACRAWFIAEGVAKYKTPEHLEVLDALPTLSSGKVDKAALRERPRS